MENNLSVSSLVSYGFETFKKNWQLLVGSYLIAGVIMIIFGALGSNSSENSYGTSAIFNIISSIVNVFLAIGLTMINLKVVRAQKADFEDLYKHYGKFLGVAVLNFILCIIIVVGFLLLVIPGIYLSLKYFFAVTYKIDKDVSISEALSLSGKLTEGIKLKLLGFVLIAVLVNIVGALCLGIGLLVTIPVTSLAYTKLYSSLVKG